MVTGVRRPTAERGAVAAEAAIVIPLLLAVAVALLWLLSLGATQLRVVDAAREAARASARGETDTAAVAAGREVAPDDAEVTVARSGGQVRVRVVAEVHGPGGLLRFLPPVAVSSEAVAAEEPG